MPNFQFATLNVTANLMHDVHHQMQEHQPGFHQPGDGVSISGHPYSLTTHSIPSFVKAIFGNKV